MTITIDDVNDNKPLFTLNVYVGKVLENKPINTIVTFSPNIQVNDADSANKSDMIYSIFGNASKYFNITDPQSAVVTSTIIFDRESRNIYNFSIRVEDVGSLYSISNVSITVSDTNDNSPVFNATVSNLSLSEGHNVNVVVFKATAIDSDLGINSKVTYSMQGGLDRFEINTNTGM